MDERTKDRVSRQVMSLQEAADHVTYVEGLEGLLNTLREHAAAVCTEPSEALDWECVKSSNLDALRRLLGIAVPS